MNPNDRTVARRLAAARRPRPLAWVACALLMGSCTSEADGSSSPAPVTDAAPTTETTTSDTVTTADQELADAILLAPDDLEGDFRALPPDGDWPYSAEIARRARSCAPYADLVFGGGAHHAPSSTVTLQRDQDALYAYVVVFPTAEEAASLMSAVESPQFDDCWSQYMNISATESAYGITEADYAKATPPEMTFDAERYFARMVKGTVIIDGAELGDSCVCVFAQVGRAVVLVHAPEEQFDTEGRVAFTQTAIDKAKELIG